MNLKITLLISFILLGRISYAQLTSPAPYCDGGYSDDDGDGFITDVPHFISNVSLGTLDNTTGDTQYPAPHYVYYNNVSAPDLVAGNTYTLSVSHDPSPSSLHHVAVYIDYNHDSSFDNVAESVLQQTTYMGSGVITNPSTVSITIPTDAKPGITRLRAMVFEDDQYDSVNAMPCTTTANSAGHLAWGETEDYNVNIVAPTGIAEVNKDNTDLLFPNPAKDVIYISKDFFGAYMIITDVQGRVVVQSKVANASINITSLTPGIYFARIIQNGVVNTQAIIVGK